MRKPKYWNKAKTYLSKKDKVMKKLINNYKDGALITRNDVFFSLCKSMRYTKTDVDGRRYLLPQPNYISKSE